MIRTLGVLLSVFACFAADPPVNMVVGSTANQYVFIPNSNIATEGSLRVFVVPTTVCAPNGVEARFSVDRFSPDFNGGTWNELFSHNERMTEIVTRSSAQALAIYFAERGMPAGFYRIRIDPSLAVVQGRTTRCVGVNLPDPVTVSHFQSIYFFVEAGIDEWGSMEFGELTRVRAAVLIDRTPSEKLAVNQVNQVVQLLVVDRPTKGDQPYFVIYQMSDQRPTNVYVTFGEGLGYLKIISHRFDRTRPVFVETINGRSGASYGGMLIDNPLSTPGAVFQ